MAHSVNWDSLFESKPPGGDNPVRGDDKIREDRTAFKERIALEHLFDYSSVNDQGYHRQGSALAYYQSSEPTTLPDGSALASNDKSKGRLWVDSDDGRLYYWDGTAWKPVDNMPIGAVMFFHGSWTDDSTIPGWYKCDSANASAHGVANLEDKFIVATGTTYSLNDTGGASTHDHTINHTHTISSGPTTARANIYFDATNDKIQYESSPASFSTTAARSVTMSSVSPGSGTNSVVVEGSTDSYTGRSNSGSSLPPYYAMLAIEKVS